MYRKLITIAVAALAVAGLATAALAAPSATKPITRKPIKHPTVLTGVWSGKTHQDIQPLSDDGEIVEWEQRITIRAWDGRLSYVGVNVRYTCDNPDNPRAGDISIDQFWVSKDRAKGPKLSPSGGFSLNITHAKNPFTKKLERLYVPVHISGVLRKGGASGSFSIGNSTCSGKGTWQAKRKF